MIWRRVMRWGLLLLLAALCWNLFLGRHVASEEGVEQLSQGLLTGGGALLAIAVLLWVLEKAGLRVSGARCQDCKKPVPHGHSLCTYHLLKRREVAQEKFHGQRGSGI